MRSADTVYRQLEEWAADNDNVRAMLLTSSRANPQATVDRFSDYDIELFVTDLRPFQVGDEWLAYFGPILVRWPRMPVEENGNITRLVLFDDGLRIDFQILLVASLRQLAVAAHLSVDYDNGYLVLLDKDGLTKGMPAPSHNAYQINPPTEAQYLEVVHDYWWDITYVAKSLWRDELFFARYMLDSVIRVNFLEPVIAWYIGLNRDWNANPNKHGRWFKRYLDPETWAEVESTFSTADPAANWVAMVNMTALFRRLAIEIADGLGYVYPAGLDGRVTTYLETINRPRV